MARGGVRLLLVRAALVALFAGWALVPGLAHAQCNGGADDTATCGDVFAAQLTTAPWTCGDQTGLLTCPNCFDGNAGANGQDSQLGEACDFAPLTCSVIGPMNCNNGPGSYTSCPGSTAGDQPQEGPEHVYAFTCPGVGSVSAHLTGLDCNLDLYVLDDTCSPSTGCVITDDDTALDPEDVSFTCAAPGQVFYVVVEGVGFTEGARDAGGVGWCDPHLGTEGNYTLTFDPSTPGCIPPVAEICDNNVDDDGDGLDDCLDPDCPDADGDGITDLCDTCPGNDDTADADGDGAPDACDPCPLTANEVDGDNDGDLQCTDCDDTEPLLESLDLDGDGWSTCAGDCVDLDPTVLPGAFELEDGVDQDCDGLVDEGTDWFDDDGDGFTELGGDCDDGDTARNPGAVETCNAADDDCDGTTDEGTECFDDDGDGFSELDGDCSDGDPTVGPGAAEVAGNGIDDDCDGQIDNGSTDDDQDGFTALGGDCDPTDGDTFPGAVELDDGVDNDCDGTIDEGTPGFDDDGDGVSEEDGDCDDTDPDTAPGAEELADGVDNDCDGAIDEGTDRVDDDGDGVTELGGDCDDADPNVGPHEAERANGQDDDCDGDTDEGLGDEDGDGWTVEDGDCNDADGWVHPQAVELCGDQLDNDCNGIPDDRCGTLDSGLGPKDSGCGCNSGTSGSAAWILLLFGGLAARRTRGSSRGA